MANDTLLRMGEESLAHYRELNELVFGGKLSNKTLFFLAMAAGIRDGIRAVDFKRSNTGPRTELTDDDFAFISAMQYVVEGESAELANEQARSLFAEEYAEGGIRQLKVWMDGQSRQSIKVNFLVMIKS